MPQQRKFIWFALVMSVVIYVFIAYSTSQENAKQPFDDAVRNPRTLVLYAMALLMFVFGFVVPRLVSVKQVGWIMGMAQFEAATIFGLLAAFLGRDWRLILPAAALTAAGFIRLYPGETEANPGSV